MRKAAARLSAESPVRKAATRAGAAILADASGGVAPSVFAMLASGFFCELQRTGIDFAARPPRKFDSMRHAVLDAVARKRRSQKVVEIVLRHDPFIGARRTDHEDELATGFQLICGFRQLRDRRTRDILVQFC